MLSSAPVPPKSFQLRTSTAVNGGGITVIGGYVGAIIRALEARGVATAAILDAAEMSQVPSNDPLSRVPLPSVQKLLGAAVELTGDPYFGLYAANFMHPSNWHALGYALLASSSLRDFCERLSRHFRLLTTTTRPRLRETADTGYLEFPRVAETPPLSDDIVGLFLVQLIRQLSDGRIRPTSIDLHRPAPPDGGVRHRRAFGCPVNFGANFVSMEFDAHSLDAALPGASRELAQYNEQLVVGYLAKLNRNDVELRLRALLLEQLPLGAVTKDDIAKRLCMSPRTLQVKLSKHNTTFQDVVNETRHALACAYMENSALSITEIAYMLGFSDTSNFSRAFRRWTGQSPREYVSKSRYRDARMDLQPGS
jgi:AraC-like DNA-binding protein